MLATDSIHPDQKHDGDDDDQNNYQHSLPFLAKSISAKASDIFPLF
jgi:hypothetical protein